MVDFARRPECSPRLSVGQSVRGIGARARGKCAPQGRSESMGAVTARARPRITHTQRTGTLRRRATSQRPCLGRVETVSRIHASLDCIAPSILPPVLAVIGPGAIDDLVPVVDRILSLVLRLFLFLSSLLPSSLRDSSSLLLSCPARGRTAGRSASPTLSRMLVD